MKKLIIFLMTAGLFAACDSDSKGKDKYDRDKSSADAREKDDYRNSDDKANADSKKPFVNKDNSNLDSKTSTDETDNGETGTGWPQIERKGFIKSCEIEAMGAGRDKLTAQSYCQCMLEKMEARYPDIKVAAKLSMQQINEFGEKNRADCLEEH
ncbi:MAG: hypothetical protein LH619_11505 [Chitinophagaceae bacterium]|nr:hypothetical protein [Chitinophagaceae bacterium]